MHSAIITWAREHDEHASFLTSELMHAIHGFNSRTNQNAGVVAAPVFRDVEDEVNAGVIMISDQPINHFMLPVRLASTCHVEMIEYEACGVAIHVGRKRFKSPSQARREARHRAERFGETEAEKKAIYEKTYKELTQKHKEKSAHLRRNFSSGYPYFWFKSKSEGSQPAPIFWAIEQSDQLEFRNTSTLGLGTAALPACVRMHDNKAIYFSQL